MLNMEEESGNSKGKDNFLFENLPGVEDMLTKTLPNKDLLYYPYNSQQNNSLNVFDFTYQKKGGELEESLSTEKANNQQQKNKKNQNQKYQDQRYKQNQKYKSQGNKNLYQVNQRFNINQTIQPESNWVLVKDFNKRILEKLLIDFNKIKVINKEICGNIYPINESFEEEISPYSPKLLQKYENMKFYGYTNTSSDNKLLNLDYSVNIYTTDKILAVLMTCIYNSHPWHLKFRKMGDKIFIEKMPNSEIDKVTVNESDNTSTIYDDKNINSYKNLNIEATLINEFIKEQIIDKEEGEEYPGASPNPLNDEDEDDEDTTKNKDDDGEDDNNNEENDRNAFYSAYIRTYIERDIRDLTAVSDEMKFLNFLRIIASRTGQVLKYSEIAEEAAISQPTVKSWLSILVSSNLVYLLQPYYKNITKRMTKMPKITTNMNDASTNIINGEYAEKSQK